MGILYALVARGSVVLAEFTATATNASSIARQILEKITGTNDTNVSYSQDRYIFHVKRTDGLTVLCMADDSAGRRIPFAFLDDIHHRFVRTYGRAVLSAQAYAMNDEFSRVLSQQMEYYSNDPNADRINRLKGEMSQVRNVMIENIDKVLERGDRLELLVDKTANMQGNTFRFRKQTRRFRNTMWWRNVKLTIALVILLLVIVYVVLAFVCHGIADCRLHKRMNKTLSVCSPYFDPDFDTLSQRVYGPACRVTIDNESLEDCTVVKIDSINKQGLLLEVVQVLTDMNFTISKANISTDASWFMDVFHVRDENGKKISDQRAINYIQKALSASTEEALPKANGRMGLEHCSTEEAAAIEMTGKDRPGLFSEISAALADLHINIVQAHAWSHNARLACVAYISDQSTHTKIDDNRLALIEDHLKTVLQATTIMTAGNTKGEEVKTAQGLPEAEGGCCSTTAPTEVERRLHQLMLSVRDFDSPPVTSRTTSLPMMPLDYGNQDEEKVAINVSIESCCEKRYSIVTVQCKDRQRLLFDTACTLIDLQYVIFHASADSHDGNAFQEYFIRHKDGCALNTESEKERVIKCLKAAIERRVCEGVRLELRATNRVGLLSDITRVLRESGLAVVRADVATQGEKAVNAFYVRDISGNNINMEFVKTMKREIGAIDLAVSNECIVTRPTSPTAGRHRFSIRELLKSQFDRFSHNFVATR